MPTSNITEFNCFDDFMDHTPFKILHGILYPTMVLIGYMGDIGKFDLFQLYWAFAEIVFVFWYLGFVYYEHFGGDPAKRSLGNKLLSKVVISKMGWGLAHFGFFWRFLVGPVSPEVAWFIVNIRQFFENMAYIYLSNTIIYRILMIYGWKYVCNIDEYFFDLAILLLNVGFCTVVQVAR